MILADELRSNGFELAAGTPPDLVVRKYLGVLHRTIPTRPRLVLQSAEFVCRQELENGYAEIKRKATAGESLMPHQSRLLDDPDYSDPLLNDWGVHHLHLGTVTARHGYVVRTDELLFARVTDHHLYSIQIYPHGSWSRQEIVRILARNWPDEIEKYRLKGIKPILPQYTDQEIQNLRNAGVQPLAQVDSNVYGPIGGGIMTSGDSMTVMVGLGNLLEYCKQLEDETVRTTKEYVARGLLPGNNFRMIRDNGKALVIEQTSRTAIVSAYWPIKQNLA